jgi:hypothetical protein
MRRQREHRERPDGVQHPEPLADSDDDPLGEHPDEQTDTDSDHRGPRPRGHTVEPVRSGRRDDTETD